VRVGRVSPAALGRWGNQMRLRKWVVRFANEIMNVALLVGIPRPSVRPLADPRRTTRPLPRADESHTCAFRTARIEHINQAVKMKLGALHSADLAMYSLSFEPVAPVLQARCHALGFTRRSACYDRPLSDAIFRSLICDRSRAASRFWYAPDVASLLRFMTAWLTLAVTPGTRRNSDGEGLSHRLS
jgi:hypothetical protein